MANPVGSFIWYELMTTDPDGAAAFYGPLVGWTIVGHPAPGAAIDYRHIIRSDGESNGGVLALSQAMCDGGARPAWLGYLHVADVDQAITAIEADGGKLLMPPFDIDVGRIAMIADPQGAPIYIMTPIPPAGGEGKSSDVYDRDAEQRIAWNELYTSDLEGAKVFYAKHFGFEFNEALPMGEMGDYCFIDHHGQRIGAMMTSPPGVPGSLWNFYIRVPDIDRAAAAIGAHGGKVLNGPMPVPTGEMIVNGVDPQGAMVSIVAQAKGD